MENSARTSFTFECRIKMVAVKRTFKRCRCFSKILEDSFLVKTIDESKLLFIERIVMDFRQPRR